MHVALLIQSGPHNAHVNERTGLLGQAYHWLPCCQQVAELEAHKHHIFEDASQAERLQWTGWPKATGLSLYALQASVWCECAELQLLLLRLCCSCSLQVTPQDIS